MTVSKDYIPRKRGIHIRLTEDEFKILKEMAIKKKLGIGSFIRMTIFEYLNEQRR